MIQNFKFGSVFLAHPVYIIIYIILALIRQCFFISNLLAVISLTNNKHGNITEDARVTKAVFYSLQNIELTLFFKMADIGVSKR